MITVLFLGVGIMNYRFIYNSLHHNTVNSLLSYVVDGAEGGRKERERERERGVRSLGGYGDEIIPPSDNEIVDIKYHDLL